MSKGRLLVVDDEENLRSMLAAALRHHDFAVEVASDGPQGLELLAAQRPDVVVLDVMMPGLDGFEVCRRMRSQGDTTPVLFLTARDETSDKVAGLRLGGDDYLEKPFSLDELVARIEAILRRGTRSDAESALTIGDLCLDDDQHIVTQNGDSVHLSLTEYRLLRYLMLNQNRVVSKSQILDQVWGDHKYYSDGIVETYMSYLRRKVDTVEPKLIHTIRGVGYVMRKPG